MSDASKSILFFGLYMISVGLLLFMVPNHVLSFFELPMTREVWIRLGGLFSVIVGGYYLQAARYELIPFYRATVVGRIIFALGIFYLVIFQKAPSLLLVVALIDIACSLTTAILLKKSE